MSAETTKAWTKANKDRVRAVQRRWALAHLEKMKAAQKLMRDKKKGLIDPKFTIRKKKWASEKERNIAHIYRYRARHPQKWAAQLAARAAIRAGKIKRPDRCQKCGSICKSHAHHEDYSKPLEVLFVCRPCHVAIHKTELTNRVTYTNAST